jgi:adsorption protein B
MISGHYCDEFAEAHGKFMPVRQKLGASLPLAGVGCAIIG